MHYLPLMTSRAYVFTINKPSWVDGEGERIISALGRAPGVRYVVGQLERGHSCSRLHLQGYLELSSAVRLSGVKKLFGSDLQPHLEPRRGSRDQARDYARKEDTRVAGPWEAGSWRAGGSGRRNDIAAFKSSIDGGADDKSLWDEHFGTMLLHHRAVSSYRLVQPVRHRDSIVVRVFFGPPGTGKSYRALAEASTSGTDPSGLITPYYVPRSANGDVWFDGYQGEEAIIIDDYYGWIKWDLFLKMLDHYPC